MKNQKHLLMIAVAGVFFATSAAGLPTDGLQAHFRADRMGRVVTTNSVVPEHGEEVYSWTSEPGVGTPLTLVKNGNSPLWQENAFQRADGTSLPAVRFGRNSGNEDDLTIHLSSKVTNLKLDENSGQSTWFIVMNQLAAFEDGRSVFGFYAGKDDNNRFGAFFPNNANNYLRVHNNANPKSNGNLTLTPGVPILVDSRGSASPNRMTSSLNGAETVNIGTTLYTRSSQLEFSLGSMVNDYAAPFDCAELAVYNRALNDAEVRIVRNALAARWGLAIENPLWKGAAAGFCDDLAGIGSSTASDDGHIPGAVNTSASTGGLVLSVTSGAFDGTDGYLLAAHDGKPAKMAWSEADGFLRVTRTWRTENTLSFVPAVTFAFDLAELGIASATVRLLYRENASSTFADTGVSGVVLGNVSSFAFAAGTYKDGEYTLAVDAVAVDGTSLPSTSDMTVWFKPETGLVTDGNGGVVKWENQGSLGSDADVHASLGTVKVVENALANTSGTASYPVLDFGGNSFLKTAAKTDLGRDGFEPPTWFIVFKPGETADDMRNSGLFGHDTTMPRFGAFFPEKKGSTTLSGYAARVYVGDSSTQSGKFTPEISSNSWHLLDMTAMYSRSRNYYTVAIDTDAKEGAGSLSDSNPFTYSVTSEYLKIGSFREDSWGKPFPGRIAELRIYKRSLNPVERLLVAKELADKYSLELVNPFLDADHASGATYAAGISVVGYENGEGECGSSSATSGGMSLDIPDWTPAGNKVFYAHNGGSLAWTTDGEITTLARSWYVRSDAVLPALRLTFLLGELEDGEAYALYYRADDTGAWTCQPYQASLANGTVSVKVPSGLATGYFTLGKIGTAGAASLPCAAVSGGLSGWYRADTGVTVVDGAVSVWRNIGLLGAVADATKALGEGSATPSTGVFAQGGVKFDGTAILKTESVKWTSSNDNTWFVVFKVAGDANLPTSSMSVFGTSSGDPRFGAMFPSSNTLRLRTHGYVENNSSKYCQFNLDPAMLGEAMIVDSLRSGRAVDTYLNGSRQTGKNNDALGNSNVNTFNIGNMAGMGSKFKGDIAEIRVYNRAISDVERNIVANHLAARYGVTMSGNLLYRGATAGCKLDLVGIGCTTSKSSSSSAEVHVPGNITVSDNSAGLVVAAAGSLSDGDYVFAGHGEESNGWISVARDVKRMKRAWHITRTNAESLDLKLTFRLPEAGIAMLQAGYCAQYKLLRSLDGGSTWIGVDVDLRQNGQEFACVLPAATFAEGQYTLGADVKPYGLTITVR